MSLPHKCVRCGATYEGGSSELLKGCSCGARVFIFLKKGQDLEEVDVTNLGWLEEEFSEVSREKPVSIDLDAPENVRMLEKGYYELNIKSLMEGNPLVVRSEAGVYYIKIPSLKKSRVEQKPRR